MKKEMKEVSSLVEKLNKLIYQKKEMAFNWKKLVHEILCSAVQIINKLCESMPTGKIKEVLNIVSTILELICKLIPVEVA